MYKKNTAITGFGIGHFINATTGATVTTGTPTCKRTLDGTGGACANAASYNTNGAVWTIDLTAADMNGDNVVLSFALTDCLPISYTIKTVTKLVSDLKDETMRGTDNAALASVLGAAVGASISADIAAVKADTTKVKFTGDYVQAQVKGKDNLDFGTLEKTSLNAATPSVTVSDKTGFKLAADGADAITDPASGSALKAIKDKTDGMNFTGSFVQAQVKGEDNIDFGALKKTSLNAATPSVTVSDKTGFVLTSAYDAAKTAAPAGAAMTLTSAYDAAKTAAPTTGQIRTELATELGRIDVAVSSRLPANSYVAPNNSDIASIKNTVEASGSDITAIGGMVESNGTLIETTKDLAEADSFIDTTKTPWEIVIHKKGDPQTVYLRKKLYDVNGGNVTATTTVIGREEHTT